MKNREALIIGYGINNLEANGTCIIYAKSITEVGLSCRQKSKERNFLLIDRTLSEFECIQLGWS
jgi:hypothetical protein